MNTNPDAKRVLCFGDSNTWGCVPVKMTRWPTNIRWTGLLQTKLGYSYEIIEEGLNARTTNLNDPKYTGKNGLEYLVPCLETHCPVDLLILMLGTNDLKERFNRDAKTIGEGIQSLLNAINNFFKEYGIKQPEIILVCPPIVDERSPEVKEKHAGTEVKSRELPIFYTDIANKNNCHFVNLQNYVKPSKEDGCHLDQVSHEIVANLLKEKIMSIFTNN